MPLPLHIAQTNQTPMRNTVPSPLHDRQTLLPWHSWQVSGAGSGIVSRRRLGNLISSAALIYQGALSIPTGRTISHASRSAQIEAAFTIRWTEIMLAIAHAKPRAAA